MSEANESQGLKVAVAAFVSISVILAVTSYFLYANAAAAQARLDAERDAQMKLRRAADMALRQYDEMRMRVGTKAEEFDPARKEISANFKKVEERLDNIMNTVNGALQAAGRDGVQGPELEDIKLNVQRAIASYRSEPNKTYISSLERLTEAMENLADLTTQLSLKYAGLKKSLEAGTSAAKGQKGNAPATKD
jgi:hypothetical protein